MLRAWEDVPLNPDGEKDAFIAANRLKFYKPKMVYSSDLQRDFRTAIIIAEVNGNLPYETDFALRTADVGSLSGMKEDQVRARILRWYQTGNEPAPSGETFNQFALRFWRFYEPKLELARGVAAFRPSVFVTHGRNIAYLDSVYRRIPPEDALMPMPGGIAVVRSNQDGMENLEFISDTEPVQEDA
jgi:broad specificity phosphatase PhoE